MKKEEDSPPYWIARQFEPCSYCQKTKWTNENWFCKVCQKLVDEQEGNPWEIANRA